MQFLAIPSEAVSADSGESGLTSATPGETFHSMQRFPMSRIWRSPFACLLLVLSLFGTSTPLLHAAAHSAHEDRHLHLGPAASQHSVALEHHASVDHEADHAASLHDDGVYLSRLSADFALPATPVLLPVAVVVPQRAPSVPYAGVHRSRAPPPGDPARAPPLI